MTDALIHLVATGGTISGEVGVNGTYDSSLVAADLIECLGDGVSGAEVALFDFSRKLSFEITLDEWLELVIMLKSWNDDPAVSAILVVQGTALLEEVPFLSSLFVRPRKPVVFTGAMIPLREPGSDAVSNLADSVAVCRDARAASFGPLVVMGGRVITAATVRKAHRQRPDAVTSTGSPAARVRDGRVEWQARPAPLPASFAAVALARGVPLIRMVLGIERSFVENVLSLPSEGLVVEGFPGGGGLPAEIAALLEPHVGRMPIVLGSRAPEGSIAHAAGGRSGAGALLDRGFISSGHLMSEKARLLLMAALADADVALGADRVAGVRRIFASYLDTGRNANA